MQGRCHRWLWRSSLRQKCNNLNFKAKVRSISLVVEVNTGSEDMTYLKCVLESRSSWKWNASMRQSRDKVVDEFTNKSKYNQLLLKKFKFESHMCCQKPRLRPRLTAFVTQGLSCGPCEAVTTAHAGSAFLGSASAGLQLWAEPCTSLCTPPWSKWVHF